MAARYGDRIVSTLNADLVKEIQERSIQQCVDLSLDLIDSMLGVGDSSMSREDRIARFQIDAADGTLDVLKVIRPDLYQRTVKQMVVDVGNSPLVTYQPETA